FLLCFIWSGTLRKEVLNAEWFYTTKQAQLAINFWFRQFNRVRPYHALGLTPCAQEILSEKPKINRRI
ncbi:MAG: transposase, partial [Rhodobacteraceae bacterium]|nr:transposase [Paracoccaceae bacterium]